MARYSSMPPPRSRATFKSDSCHLFSLRSISIAPGNFSARAARVRLACTLSNPESARNSALLIPFRSEEHTSELESLMRISYAVFSLQKKIKNKNQSEKTTENLHKQQ